MCSDILQPDEYEQPPKTKVGQSGFTLRFKIHRLTVLLACNETESFETLKNDVLDAIKATGLKDIDGEKLPEEPQDVIFGVPMDKNNMDKGWVNLEIPEFDEGETKKKGGVKKGSVLNASPVGAGLKDGDMLAVRFRKAPIDEMELDDDWEVTLPNLDDAYDEA